MKDNTVTADNTVPVPCTTWASPPGSVAVLFGANKGRVASQPGVAKATVVKTALTGAELVLDARMGEQQRPAQVTSGLLGRLQPGRSGLTKQRSNKQAGAVCA